MNEILEYDLSPYIQSIYDGITFESSIKFMIVYFFIVWIALIIWVIKDIVNRSDSIILQTLSILIILIGTPLGIFIYLLMRPSQTLFEKYNNEVEDNLDIMENMIEEKNNDLWNSLHCFSCETPILPEFKYCPKCTIELKFECKSCDKIVYRNWELCPYCWDEQNHKDEAGIPYNKIEKKKNIIKNNISKEEEKNMKIINHVKIKEIDEALEKK
jgi:hypothetical protein